jgi:SAM-dependent MidA family methyltransferase
VLNDTNGNPELISLIREEIAQRGPVSFAWFMQQALYHSEHGYYSSGRCAIGRRGDYFTNVSVGPIFGQLMAAQFAEIWNRLDKSDHFVIVEQGAHDGQFASDVLQSAQLRAPQFFEALHYRIVEPFAVLRERQSRMLEPFQEKITWSQSLEPFKGVHFSNELLDAMPVRLINHGVEKVVGIHDGEFVFIDRPTSRAAPDQIALNWIDELASNLQEGYAIVVDYGHSSDELPRQIQVRARHRQLDSPFEQIGHADITMHLDWSSIVRRAEAAGLNVAGFADQHHFLTGLISTWPHLLQPPFPNAQAGHKTGRALQTLLHPEMLGRAFQVLIMGKNIDCRPLAGFRFASAADSAFGSKN